MLNKTHYGLVLGLFVCFSVHATTSPVVQTQTKLKKLDAEIVSLKQTLAFAQDKRGVLNQGLTNTQKEIGAGAQQLLSIQTKMANSQQKITQLQDKVTQLSEQLKTQQHLLAKHVRARYQMGEYQAMKWLIEQDEPYKISRILTYYQYIVASRQHLIAEIDETRKHLNESKDILSHELTKNTHIKDELLQHQQQLVEHKNYHSTLIHTLTNEIENKQRNLEEAQRNKDNLSRLLKSLAQESAPQPSHPFAQMRRKLPRPVQAQANALHKTNQGLTFFAEEGTQVVAVYPGKVVFSDWLKGYGLLLILDHGQGFMTLYANNKSLFKHKGQSVTQNEPIAIVGHSGNSKQNGLYFEVRVKGKAVSPLEWLS